MKSLRHLLIAVLAVAALNARAADTYKIDAAHATVSFTITHLLISEVGGRFNDIAGEITVDKEELTGAKATLQTKSIDTGNAKRDEHLRGADFFDAEKFPTITFEGAKVEKDGKLNVIVGKFTMHGVTKEIKVPFVLKGPITDPWGSNRIAVTAETVVSRKDYGVGASSPAIGDEVKIKISVEGIKAEEKK
jgi:polyisoprenoid-binding protein YceI